MTIRTYIAGIGGAVALSCSVAFAHPMDGLSADEYAKINAILKQEGVVTDQTLYPMIDLHEAPKADVLAWKAGGATPDRKAMVQYTSDEGFREAIVNITDETVESDGLIEGTGQPMILFAEFMDALEGALGNQDMINALAKRNLTPDQAFCLPLTAGNFFTDEEVGRRLMRVPCYKVPEGSNFYAKPIENLFAVYDLNESKVLRVIDEGAIELPTDPWGYTEEEVAERLPLRPETNPAKLSQPGGPNFKLNGTELEWDIWRAHLRTEKRAGLVVSNIEANDQGTWRSVIYQTHLSEVFVPYMDPTEGWYWRTYMDSGEYGFGLFLTPLERGVDCPAYASFLPAMIADDEGNPLEIPDAICIFERNIGDPHWRHFEIFAQSPEQFVPAEGRPHTELVIRTASEVGNYDYLIDYRFHQDGQVFIKVGATGLDAVKGVQSVNTSSPTYAEDTKYGTLIAPNLVAANHDHYFNFRIDFDVDRPENMVGSMDIVPAKVAPDALRRSMWTVEHNMFDSELNATFNSSTGQPRYLHVHNHHRTGHLGHTPGWMIHHGSVARGPFDFENDPPMKRNAYIKNSVWNTVYDPGQRYAGGKYALQSDGSDTLAEWVKEDRPLHNQDIVTWFSAGFHHIPRMEDWPVMSTEWKVVHIMPHNFFAHNPALTIRKDK